MQRIPRLKNSGQLAGGCAEKCSVIIMCTLLHRVSIVVTSLSGLSRGKLAVNVWEKKTRVYLYCVKCKCAKYTNTDFKIIFVAANSVFKNKQGYTVPICISVRSWRYAAVGLGPLWLQRLWPPVIAGGGRLFPGNCCLLPPIKAL